MALEQYHVQDDVRRKEGTRTMTRRAQVTPAVTRPNAIVHPNTHVLYVRRARGLLHVTTKVIISPSTNSTTPIYGTNLNDRHLFLHLDPFNITHINLNLSQFRSCLLYTSRCV